MVLYDARHKVLHSGEVELSQAGWSEKEGLFHVYAAEKSYVHFERNASYLLDVSYTPGAVPPLQINYILQSTTAGFIKARFTAGLERHRLGGVGC